MFAKARVLLPVLLLLSMAVGAVGAGIDGPEKIVVGAGPAKFAITGATVADLVKSQAKLIWYPRDRVSVWEAATWDGEPYVLVSATASGKFLLAVSYVAGGKIVYVEREVEATGADPPLPPGPQPDPQPDPPPQPGAKLQIVFVVKSSELDNYPRAQQTLLASLTLRKQLEAQGHRFLALVDKDLADSVPAALAPYLRATEGKPLPRIAVAPASGGTIVEYPLPADEAALLKLVGDAK